MENQIEEMIQMTALFAQYDDEESATLEDPSLEDPSLDNLYAIPMAA